MSTLAPPKSGSVTGDTGGPSSKVLTKEIWERDDDLAVTGAEDRLRASPSSTGAKETTGLLKGSEVIADVDPESDSTVTWVQQPSIFRVSLRRRNRPTILQAGVFNLDGEMSSSIVGQSVVR